MFLVFLPKLEVAFSQIESIIGLVYFVGTNNFLIVIDGWDFSPIQVGW